MKFYYDFHIHTALSPCGDDEMTPNNIVNMCMLAGLDAIAVTDHNAVGNAEAVMKASAALGGPLVLAGMELETCEEVHVIFLFESVEQARLCEREVDEKRFKIKNKPSVYGRQLFMDEHDCVTGEQEELLVVSTSLGVYDCAALAAKYGGAAYPAHVDKPAHGIIAILGALNEDMGFYAAEVSPNCGDELIDGLKGQGYKIMYDSDTHYLDSFNERDRNYIELEHLDAHQIIQYIKTKIKAGE